MPFPLGIIQVFKKGCNGRKISVFLYWIPLHVIGEKAVMNSFENSQELHSG